MLILFPKRNGVKIATALIFKEIDTGASFHYILGMIDFAKRFGAITGAEAAALLEYVKERG